MSKLITKEARAIRKYLKELIADYCYEQFDSIEADYILKKKLNNDLLDELSKKIIMQIFGYADTAERKFKILTGTDIQETWKL